LLLILGVFQLYFTGRLEAAMPCVDDISPGVPQLDQSAARAGLWGVRARLSSWRVSILLRAVGIHTRLVLTSYHESWGYTPGQSGYHFVYLLHRMIRGKETQNMCWSKTDYLGSVLHTNPPVCSFLAGLSGITGEPW